MEVTEIDMQSDLESDLKKLKGTDLEKTSEYKKILNSVVLRENLKKDVEELLNNDLMKDSVFNKNRALLENSLKLDIFSKKETIKSSIQTYLNPNSK